MGSSRCTFEPCRGTNYSAGCVCPVGTTGPDGGPCTACAVGTYKDATGDAACANCSSTKTSVLGGTSCFCPNGTALVDGTCAQVYSEGVRLCGVIKVDESNSSNTSNASVDIDFWIQEIRSSVAAQYNISESLVQVTFSSTTTASRHLLSETDYHFDVLIMARSKEELARVVNLTSTEPPRVLEDVKQTIIEVSLQQGAIVMCPENEVSTGEACVCAAGYSRCPMCGKCVACAAGTAKAVIGDQACDSCANNTFSRKAAAQCSACPFSAATKDNHTSCSCNTAFVFFNDVCTATEAVYLNVTGVLQLPQGEFTDAQLVQILLDGFSAYLNYSKEFITIIINHKDNIEYVPEVNASNVTGNSSDTGYSGNVTSNSSNDTDYWSNDTDYSSNDTGNSSNDTGNSSIVTSNSSNDTDYWSNDTYSYDYAYDDTDNPSYTRRLLADFPVEFDYTALMKIEMNDKITYEKVKEFSRGANDATGETKSITNDASRITFRRASIWTDYLDNDGTPVEPCADGRKRIIDFITEMLTCPPPVPVTTPVPKTDTSMHVIGAGVAGGVAVAAIVVFVVVRHFRKKRKQQAEKKKQEQVEKERLLPWQGIKLSRSAPYPVQLHFSPTVSFEYHLLPGQSI